MRALLWPMLAVVSCMARPHGPAQPQPIAVGGLLIAAPAGWEREAPAGAPRLAQWSIAAVAGDPEDAQVVLDRLGPGGVGAPDASVERWSEQLQPEPGQPVARPSVERLERDGMTITMFAFAGRYVGPAGPRAEVRHDRPGFRLLAAVIDTGDGAYELRLLGPAATVSTHEAGFRAVLDRLRRRPD